jgi:peptidoglycan hydrolase-like protein with peptidoglycan-binding domain
VETGVLRPPETDETYNFRIGTVRPFVSVKGLQNRLHNLGYFQGAQDGIQTLEFEDALRAFQLARRLPQTGNIDPATTQALKDFHGS